MFGAPAWQRRAPILPQVGRQPLDELFENCSLQFHGEIVVANRQAHREYENIFVIRVQEADDC
jgi:hypothetical protein